MKKNFITDIIDKDKLDNNGNPGEQCYNSKLKYTNIFIFS